MSSLNGYFFNDCEEVRNLESDSIDSMLDEDLRDIFLKVDSFSENYFSELRLLDEESFNVETNFKDCLFTIENVETSLTRHRLISVKESEKIFYMNTQTVFYPSNISLEKGRKLNFIAAEFSKDSCYVAFAYDDECLMKLSHMPSIYKKLQLGLCFSKCQENDVKIILNKLKSENSISCDENPNNLLQSSVGLDLMYELCLDKYPAKTQARIKTLVDEIKRDETDTDTEKNKRILKEIYSIDQITKNEVKIKSVNEIRDIIDSCFFMNEEKKEKFVNILYSQQFSSDRICVLLVGPPGTGKTTWAKILCQIFEKPYEKIHCDGLWDGGQLSGIHSTFRYARAGEIAEKFIKHSSTNIILMLEEIDKMGKNNQYGDPYAVLNSLLDPTQKEFHDEYHDVNYDTRMTDVVATANYIEDIPDYILNRFEEIILFEKYTNEEKAEIAKKYLVKKELNKYPTYADKIIFEDGVLLLLANNYTSDEGCREISSRIRELIRIAIKNMDLDKLDSIDIDKKFVIDNLERKTTVKAKMGFLR